MSNKKFWMIVREDKNDGYGNVPTKKHDSETEAEKEAERLCAKHPEGDFYILESSQTFRGIITVDRVNHFSEKEE